jgi:tellurite resistance protein TerC
MLSLWAGFIAVVLVLVGLDLFVFHRTDKPVTVRAALGWSAVWVALAMLFNVAIYFMYRDHWQGLGTHVSALHPKPLTGRSAAVLFFTGYVVEQSLSIDNLFVMAVIFNYFAIPPKYQHRVLFWGILGVLVMRGVMIGVGAALVSQFHWILYVFGGILLFTAYKMLRGGGEPDPTANPLVRVARRFFPLTHEFHGHRFVVRASELGPTERVENAAGREGVTYSAETKSAEIDRGATGTRGGSTLAYGRRVLTPLALALVVIETTDVLFAVDSIPAIFAITTDPFLVFTSNVCAVLGLRSMYFALAGILEKFAYLKYSLAAILGLVGIKMLANDYVEHIHGMHVYTLVGIALLLGGGMVASAVWTPKKSADPVA